MQMALSFFEDVGLLVIICETRADTTSSISPMDQTSQGAAKLNPCWPLGGIRQKLQGLPLMVNRPATRFRLPRVLLLSACLACGLLYILSARKSLLRHHPELTTAEARLLSEEVIGTNPIQLTEVGPFDAVLFNPSCKRIFQNARALCH